jgi:hypothetical protein
MPRLSILTSLLLLAASPFALAESPMPDPIPPAVVGRPLEHTWTYRVAPSTPAATKKPAAKTSRPTHAARKPAASTQGLGAAASSSASAGAHRAKQALDDRADPNTILVNVGEGTHYARKPLGPGVYFADRHRAAVRKYYQEHPQPGGAVRWQIGEPVPSGATLAPVPQSLLASLPKLPPGHRYAELGGEVVLIASGSKMVVDGISRAR